MQCPLVIPSEIISRIENYYGGFIPYLLEIGITSKDLSLIKRKLEPYLEV